MLLFFSLIFGLFATVIVFACYVLVISFSVWMAIDAGKQDRFWWLTIIIGIPIIGAGAYYFTEKKHEYARAEIRNIHKTETEEQHEKAPKKRAPRKLRAKEVVTQEVQPSQTESIEEKTESILEAIEEEKIENK